MNKFFRSIRPAAVAASITAAAGSAMAALPEAVPTAITATTTDGTTLIGLLAAAGAAIFIIAKVLKRFGIFL